MNYSLSISKVWFVRSECTLCVLPLVDICFALPSPRGRPDARLPQRLPRAVAATAAICLFLPSSTAVAFAFSGGHQEYL